MIGDSVNLSARIMQAACMHKDETYKILCSEATVRQAEHKISFKYENEHRFKVLLLPFLNQK